MDDQGEDMNNWMTERDGIPHKDGKVRFYLVGFDEDVYKYLGWYDMTDWDEGWLRVWADAKAYQCGDAGSFQVFRHDQLLDLKRNVDNAFEQALEDKDETTWIWWIQQERNNA